MHERTLTPDDGSFHAIPQTLPLLEHLNKSHDIEKNKPFSGYKVLAVQHLLGSTVPLFLMLERGGVKKEDMHIVGKAYSSHPSVVDFLSNHGFDISGNVFDFVANNPYDSMLEANISKAFESFMTETEHTGQKGLIIDDGGKAIKMLHERYPALAGRFVGVEQTSRGARVVESLHAALPVINVARSEAKTLYESPLIGKSMVDEFLESLPRWEKNISIRNNVVMVLGYGFIGECVTRELEKAGYSVIIYDSSEDVRAKAVNDGKNVVDARHHGYEKAGIIAGCTGTPSIPLDEFGEIHPGTLLVNMASTDTEFSAWELRGKGKVLQEHKLKHDFSLDQGDVSLPWRSLYEVTEGDTYFYLANGGFPIDFSGNMDPIDPQKIQLTRALLMGAALQAVQSTEPGLTTLDESLQKNIVDEYKRINNS